MAARWDELENTFQDDELRTFSERVVRPELEALSAERDVETTKKITASLTGDFTKAFFGFVIVFGLIFLFFPDGFWGTAIKFALFPVLFFGSFALVAYLRRESLASLLMAAQANFLTRSKALSEMAARTGLSYVPTPGGAPESLKILSKIGFMPQKVRDLVRMLDEHGGLDDAVEAAVASGMMVPDIVVLGGNEQQKARYYRQTALGHSFEDGFEGVRNGVSFSAFEWIESVEDEPSKYHLLVVLKAPHRLHGVTQLRSRSTPWPKPVTEQDLHDVQLVPETFNDHFRLRSTDQVEARTIFNPAVVERILALAHGEPFRAVGSGAFLVINFEGLNRFNLVDLHTGEWSDDSLRQTWQDIAELLSVIDEMAHAFMVRD